MNNTQSSAMGSNQSTLSAAMTSHERAVLGRLGELQLENNQSMEDDYVFVDNEKTKPVDVEDHLSSRQPETVSVSRVADWQDAVLRDPRNRLAISAFSTANPRDVLSSRATKIADQHVFNIKIPFEGGPITNQRQTGRCWLFASTNIFRVALMQKYGLDSFELSQAYLFFWDKLEKSNWFLEQIISTAGMDLDSRLVQTLLREPLSDGGQWDMVYNLVTKYGLVPQALYPDSFSASASSVLNSILFTKLRSFALTLRTLLLNPSTTPTTLSTTKAKMLRDIHTILTLTLTPPPSPTDEFTWSFTDKTGAARTVRTTPLSFAADISSPAPYPSPSRSSHIIPTNIANLTSLVHDPRHPPLTHLTVDRLGNVVGGGHERVSYINVSMATLKQACVAMLRRGTPVFFGCDVGKFSESRSGVMDLEVVDYEVGFGEGVGNLVRGMDKGGRLRTGESRMTHAMVLTGCFVGEDGRETVRWRVQNSWGTGVGEAGWFVMSDGWMDEFVYQAVVDLAVVGREVREVLKKEPVMLPLWDPMGSLA